MATKKAKRVTKKVVKKVQKKVVRRVVKAPERIQNIDLVEFFKTGEKQRSDDWTYIIDNVMYCQTNHPKPGDSVAVGVKVDGYTVINGDNITDRVGDAGEVVNELQEYGDKEITTSFECLKNAGIDLQKIKVLGIYKDLDGSSEIGDDGFEDFESTVPQGATYIEWPNYDSDLDEDDPEYEAKSDEITSKRYHRAGCMLVREGKFSYICGMDEESYFVTQLPKNPKTIEAAFQSLKPKKVQVWEKKNGKSAQRQGEWFFLPTELTKVKGMRRKGLPLWKTGGNKHIADGLAIHDGENFVKGDITHRDHTTTRLGKVIHEAIMNTALGSWSMEGVD